MLSVKQIVFLFLNLSCAASIHTKIYSHQTKNQQLCFFGSTHSHNPRDSQYKKMKAALATFVQYSPNTKVILIEGNSLQPSKTTSEEQAIRQGGDRSFAHLLGTQEDITIVNADLDKQTQTKRLLEEHSLEVVHAWSKRILIRMWNRFTTQDKPSSLDSYVTSHLQTWFTGIDLTNLKNTPISNAQMDALNVAIMTMRQDYTFDVIQDYWNQGYDIFIVYGAAHARAHEQKIRALLK